MELGLEMLQFYIFCPVFWGPAGSLHKQAMLATSQEAYIKSHKNCMP